MISNTELDEIIHDQLSWYTLVYKPSGWVASVTIPSPTLDIEIIDTKEGEEGDWATDTYVVFKIGDKVYKKTGYYRSHEGTEWDGALVEVKPVEKTITVWEEV